LQSIDRDKCAKLESLLNIHMFICISIHIFMRERNVEAISQLVIFCDIRFRFDFRLTLLALNIRSAEDPVTVDDFKLVDS